MSENQKLRDRYVQLVESGDAGNWDAEKEPEVIAALSAQAVPNPWRDAVIEQLESWHIYVPAIHENSPRLAIKALVNIETKAALDPAVSSQAAALVAQAAPELLDSLRALTHSLDPDHFEHDDQREAFKQAVAAITKATGATHE